MYTARHELVAFCSSSLLLELRDTLRSNQHGRIERACCGHIGFDSVVVDGNQTLQQVFPFCSGRFSQVPEIVTARAKYGDDQNAGEKQKWKDVSVHDSSSERNVSSRPSRAWLITET